MERERSQPQPTPDADGLPPRGDSLEPARQQLHALQDAIDRALAGIDPVDAELALQQNRQAGGQ